MTDTGPARKALKAKMQFISLVDQRTAHIKGDPELKAALIDLMAESLAIITRFNEEQLESCFPEDPEE